MLLDTLYKKITDIVISEWQCYKSNYCSHVVFCPLFRLLGVSQSSDFFFFVHRLKLLFFLNLPQNLLPTATPQEAQQWLLRNRFSPFCRLFTNFSGKIVSILKTVVSQCQRHRFLFDIVVCLHQGQTCWSWPGRTSFRSVGQLMGLDSSTHWRDGGWSSSYRTY